MSVEDVNKSRNANDCCMKRRALTPYGLFWVAYVAVAIAALAWSPS